LNVGVLSGFFDEWEDEQEAFKQDVQITILFLLLSLGITTVLSFNPVAVQNATIILFLILIALVFSLIEWFSEQAVGDKLGGIISLVSEGTKTNFYFATLVGFGIGGFLSGTALVILTPLAAISLQGLNQQFYGFLFNVILAPFAEEKFFRGFITPTFIGLGRNNEVFQRVLMSITVASFPLLFGEFLLAGVLAVSVFLLYTYLPVEEGFLKDLLSITIAAVPFGLFHFYVYHGGFNEVFGAVGFGVAMAFGNYAFKTTGFGLGVHVSNNLIAHLRSFGSILNNVI